MNCFSSLIDDISPNAIKLKPIKFIPIMIRLILPVNLIKDPHSGLKTITAIEYELKTYPIHPASIPFSSNLKGKKGAIIAYAEFVKAVRPIILMTSPSNFNFLSFVFGLLFSNYFAKSAWL